MGRRAARLWTRGGGGAGRDGRHPSHFVCEYWAGSLSSYSVGSVACLRTGLPGDIILWRRARRTDVPPCLFHLVPVRVVPRHHPGSASLKRMSHACKGKVKFLSSE